MSDPYNPENSPEKLKLQGERVVDPRWETLGEDGERPQASPEEWEAQMGRVPTFEEMQAYREGQEQHLDEAEIVEHPGEVPVYEKVETAPVYGVDGENDEFNQLMNEYLTKGFWLRVKEYVPAGMETEATLDQFEDVTEGLRSEGGDAKFATLSETGMSGAAAVTMFELSKRADFKTEELAEVAKGMPELDEGIALLVGSMQDIKNTLENGTTAEELREKYVASLGAAEGIHESLVRADAPMELAGAILAKTGELEEELKVAIERLTPENLEAKTAEEVTEGVEQDVKEMSESAEKLGGIA